jgi:SnoaL-like domain
MNDARSPATEELHGRDALISVFDALHQYDDTMHFNGQCTIKLAEPGATADTYCIAHHVFSKDGERQIFVAYLRYEDEFAKEQGSWRFAPRKLYVEFTDSRPLAG